MKILVTGGSGFIGSHLIDALINDHDVISLDIWNPENNGHYDVFSKGDCTEDFAASLFAQATLRKEPLWTPDVVVHLAATSSVGESIEHPDETNLNNLQKTIELLMLCQAYKVKRFIFASSAAVEDVYSSPYAIQKKAGEEYCRFFARQKGLDTVSLRFFNVYGPGAQKGVIAEFCKAIVNGESMRLHNRGEDQRDFIYVSDVVEAILIAIDQKSRFNGAAFRVGTGLSTYIVNLATALEEISGTKRKRVYVHRQSEIGFSRGANDLGFKLMILKDGLTKTLEWWRKQK